MTYILKSCKKPNKTKATPKNKQKTSEYEQLKQILMNGLQYLTFLHHPAECFKNLILLLCLCT